MLSIRYLVTDVETSVKFYTESLGFELKQQFGPAMVILTKNGVNLWLAGPLSSAAQTMPDGQRPGPGGWNRLVLEIEDLSALTAQLRSQNVQFKTDKVKGPGGSHVLCQDPSGNLIELFQQN